MLLSSQRDSDGRLVCGGRLCVGHPTHIFADLSGNPQAPFLAALLTAFASSSVFFLLFLRVRWVSQACPVHMASLELLAPR